MIISKKFSENSRENLKIFRPRLASLASAIKYFHIFFIQNQTKSYYIFRNLNKFKKCEKNLGMIWKIFNRLYEYMDDQIKD